MLAVLTVLGCVAFVEPAARKEPPAREELAAIAERGRNLAGYDAAAWHASDALQQLQPKQGAVAQYIARQTDKGWIVAFGRLDEAKESFLIAYRASQGDKPDEFRVEELTPPTKDATFFLAAARSIDTALRDFVEHYQGERRPYNVAVLPAENDQLWVYLVPAPTKVGVWPLGGDVRYLISADGAKVVSKRQLHKSIIEVAPPEDKAKQQVAGVHTHVLDDAPEDTDVFHVLTRKSAVPEMVVTTQFVFQVDPDGDVKYVGKADEVLKKP